MNMNSLMILLTLVGICVAWRRNPSYSVRSGLRIVGAVVLSLIGMLLAIVTMIHFSSHFSLLVQVGTMLTVVSVTTVSMIFAVQAAATPREAKLTTAMPPAAAQVQVGRRRIYRWGKVYLSLLVISDLLGHVIPGFSSFPLYVAGLTLAPALIVFPLMYQRAWRQDRTLTALKCRSWTHWQYSPAQWREWIEVRYIRAQALVPPFLLRRDWRKVAKALGVVIACGVVAVRGTWWFKALDVGTLSGMLLVIFMWISWSSSRAPGKLRASLTRAAPEVYIGHDGLYCDGVVTTWLGFGMYLTAATIDDRQPRSVLFSFEKMDSGPYTGTGGIVVQRSVLIPAGADADLARLQRLLADRCPNAKIALM
jgi:hypothetical protein